MQKKIVSLLLVACMLLAMLPALALNMFAAEETYKTSFGENSDNYPSVDLTAGTVTYSANWKVGAVSATVTANGTSFGPVTFGTGFSLYTKLDAGTGSILDTISPWASNANGTGGGFGVGHSNQNTYKNMMLMGVNYNKIPSDTGVQSTIKTEGALFSLPSIRYIAEYSGTVALTFDVAYPKANGTTLAVLQNGVVIGTFANGTTTGTIEDVTVALGDTIDFVSVPDFNYDYDSYAAAGYTIFDYNSTKRGLKVNEFAVEFAAGYFTPDIGMSEANAEIVHALANTNINAPERYFFAWYTADGTRIPAGQAGIFNADCYAVINPYLVENGIVSVDDTYQAAIEKYRVWLKNSIKVNYTGNWSIGEIQGGTDYDAFLYPAFIGEKNPYMLRKASAGMVVSEFGTNRLISERQFNKMFDSWYDASFQGTVTQNNTIPTATTVVGDIKIAYNENLLPSGSQGNGMAHAPTSIGATGGIETLWWNNLANAFYVRPGSTSTTSTDWQAGAITYTAPATGVVKFDAHAVKFHSSNVTTNPTTENLDTKVAVFINGVQQTTWATIDNKNGNNPADQLDALIATMGTIVVYAGDEVQFVCVRGATGGTHVNMSIEAFLDTSKIPVVYKAGDKVLMQVIANKGEALPVLEGYPTFGASGFMVNGVYTTKLPETVEEGILIEDFTINTAASIAIAGDFYVNVYVDGGDTVTSAGIIVNGVVLAGEKQANGTYKVVVTAVAAANLLDTEIKYNAYQYHTDGTYRLARTTVTVNTGALLDTYINGETDTATKNMADAIRDYAYIADIYFNNKALPSNDPVKNELKGQLTIQNGQNGSTHTNYNSGLYDVMLATLKMYSVEGYVPAYDTTNCSPSVTVPDTFVPAPNVFPANKVEWGFGDQDPTAATFKYNINGITLNLTQNVGFAIKIAANGANAIADLVEGDYQLKVTIGNGIVHYYDAFVYVDETKSEAAIIVDGVPAGFFDQDYTFTVVDAEGNAVSATLTYSVMAWLVNEYKFCDGSNKGYLLRALFRMSVVAEEYLNR